MYRQCLQWLQYSGIAPYGHLVHHLTLLFRSLHFVPNKCSLISLTLFRPGYFWSSWGGGLGAGGWGLGGGFRPHAPPLNFENIKAMKTKLKRQIVRQKTFPLRSATSADDVIWRHNKGLFSNGGHIGSAILDILFFQNIQNPPKLITKWSKSISWQGKWSKNVKFTSKK